MIQKFHRIKELKAKYGLSNVDLATVSGCSENSIVSKLKGDKLFKINEAARLIKFFVEKGENVTFEELFFNEVFSIADKKGA